MAKMWEGVTNGVTEKNADEFNSSIGVDKIMYKEDIDGSIAHAKMLSKCGIIGDDDKEKIVAGLIEIKNDIECGKLEIGDDSEDIHMFVEETLTARIGDTGKKLHTARSRNDQVALDMRLFLLKKTDDIVVSLKTLVAAIVKVAEENIDAIMPGYTHLQRAQPVLFAHHILSYAWMLKRDIERLSDSKKRTAVSPIGSCALAGTTFNTDRFFEAGLLDLDLVCENSIDGVSDRDFCVELLSDISIIMMHLSRFAEETVLWSSWEFKFVSFSDLYTTGSSIMPQKKNPDMAELIRGKTGRVYGDLIGLLTTLKGLPLAYNKDMQEDKEGVFDAVTTVIKCLDIFSGMLLSLKVHKENMLIAAEKGFINATDFADYLVGKGMPFRAAYKISGKTVNRCIADNTVLEKLPLEVYKEYSELVDSDVYEAVNLNNCIKRRTSFGGTGYNSVKHQVELLKNNILQNL